MIRWLGGIVLWLSTGCHNSGIIKLTIAQVHSQNKKIWLFYKSESKNSCVIAMGNGWLEQTNFTLACINKQHPRGTVSVPFFLSVGHWNLVIMYLYSKSVIYLPECRYTCMITFLYKSELMNTLCSVKLHSSIQYHFEALSPRDKDSWDHPSLVQFQNLHVCYLLHWQNKWNQKGSSVEPFRCPQDGLLSGTKLFPKWNHFPYKKGWKRCYFFFVENSTVFSQTWYSRKKSK